MTEQQEYGSKIETLKAKLLHFLNQNVHENKAVLTCLLCLTYTMQSCDTFLKP